MKVKQRKRQKRKGNAGPKRVNKLSTPINEAARPKAVMVRTGVRTL